jgi:hypothetical protein
MQAPPAAGIPIGGAAPSSNPLGGLMSFMQGSAPPPAPPMNYIPKPSENKPIQIGPKKSAIKQAPPPAPMPEMKPPTINIDDLLKDIKQSVIPPSGSGPPPPEKVGKSSGRSKAGSTGKNSVVIKL